MVTIRRFHDEPYMQLFFSPEQQDAIAQINQEENLSVKRCLFWNFLADCMLANQNTATLIQYETLVEQPDTVISHLFGMPPADIRRYITKSNKKKSELHLSDEDRESIQTICRSHAERLGYQV